MDFSSKQISANAIDQSLSNKTEKEKNQQEILDKIDELERLIQEKKQRLKKQEDAME